MLNISAATVNPIVPVNQDIQPVQLQMNVSPLFPRGDVQPPSDFRRVFQTSNQMKGEFVKFLKTIFYRLDEKKVLGLMENLLGDPTKTDEQVYTELVAQIHTTKKNFSSLKQLWSLFVLKKGIGSQVAEFMQGFRKEKFCDYLEVYDRRYVDTIRKTAKLPLNGSVIAVCNSPEIGFGDRIQAGALLGSYPYKQHVALNDNDCEDPFLNPEKTHRPIGDEVANGSVDMIACVGGLHHIPADRLEPFTQSMHSKLRPGGVIFIREHNVADQAGTAQLPKEDLRAIASVVHSFVNASDGVSWEVESKEVREFKSSEEWVQLMQTHGFTRISDKALVLPDDPTENAMLAFVKAPANLEELQQAIGYRNDCTRPKNGTWATWIEWGNVRFSKQYAEFIQDHHSYAFDYVGHMRQHWRHFYQFLKESINDNDVKLKDLLFSDNMAMNLFILATTTIQCSLSTLTNLPSTCIARWKHGSEWRTVANLTALERFDAQNEKEYSDFIDHTPFYMYDYIGKMKSMWSCVWNAPESLGTKLASAFSAVGASLGFIAKAIISAPIKAFYTAEGNQEPDTIKILIADPNNELDVITARWEREKDERYHQNQTIQVIHQTLDGHKLVSMPRYKPFTQICGYLSEAATLQVLEIGGQKEISIDILVNKQERPAVEGARLIYETEKLQDPAEKHYLTYQVHLSALKQFQQTIQLANIEYIHE